MSATSLLYLRDCMSSTLPNPRNVDTDDRYLGILDSLKKQFRKSLRRSTEARGLPMRGVRAWLGSSLLKRGADGCEITQPSELGPPASYQISPATGGWHMLQRLGLHRDQFRQFHDLGLARILRRSHAGLKPWWEQPIWLSLPCRDAKRSMGMKDLERTHS